MATTSKTNKALYQFETVWYNQNYFAIQDKDQEWCCVCRNKATETWQVQVNWQYIGYIEIPTIKRLMEIIDFQIEQIENSSKPLQELATPKQRRRRVRL